MHHPSGQLPAKLKTEITLILKGNMYGHMLTPKGIQDQIKVDR